MLIVHKDETSQILEQNLHPMGFEFIIYRNPLKAMDNIEEVKPDIVIFSAADFPRHWKPFLNLLRKDRKKDECVMVLLVGDFFPFEEAAKAVYLQANGVIGEDLQRPESGSRSHTDCVGTVGSNHYSHNMRPVANIVDRS